MTGIALRGLAERKLRTVLTAIAVVLGVAMIAGTYVQTDRIRSAFENIEQTARSGTDVVVSPRTSFTNTTASLSDAMDESVLASVRQAPGVARAEGALTEGGQLVVDGNAVGSSFAPSMVISHLPEPFSPFRYVEGGPPSAPGQVAIDPQLADDEGLEIGSRVGLSTRTGVKPVVVTGIAKYGDVASIGGAQIVVALLPDMQRWFARRGEVSEIVADARQGVSDEQLAASGRGALPRDLLVETGSQNAESTADDVNDSLGAFLTPALLALSGAALLVGAFIIFNTFSITVAQRTREFGLLRAMGATRRQILAAVGAEALLLGVTASVVGLFGGLGVAALMGSLFDAAGSGIPVGAPELAPRTIAIALGVGILVTMIAALAPARRATRVPPLAALSADAGAAARPARWAPYAAGAVSVLGLAMLVQGLFGSGPATARLGALAGGAVLLFVGIALVSRYIVRPVAGAIGWPLQRAFHEPGRLARENAMRNPGRTATTSAALMVGVGLVVFVAVFAASLKSSISGSVEEQVRADLIVSGKSFYPIPAGAGQTIVNVPGVRATSPQYVDQIEVNGKPVNASTDQLDGVDAVALGSVYEPEWRGDSSDALFARLRGDNALIEEQFAERHGIAVGDRFRVETAAGHTRTLTAIGEYADPLVLQGVMVSAATYQRLSELRDPYAFFVATDPGVDPEEVQPRVEAALAKYPTAETRTKADYRELIEGQLDTIVYLLYALLAMSLVISLFGIANSLFLSIHERVREFGLLRAIGSTQAQVRRIVRYESVITAVIGGLLGICVGVVFAGLASAALADLGLGFVLPAGQLLVFLVLAVVVGVAGAVVPARRAAGIDVLEAMHHE